MALVLAVGCGDDGSDTDTDDATDSGATAPNTSTNPTTTSPTTTEPSTGDEATAGDSSTGGTETGAPAVDYMADIQPIWNTRCVEGCHIETGIAQAQGPILTAEKSYDELVDADSPTVAGIVQVKAGDLDGSYVWHKVNGTQSNVGGLGAQMPLGGMLSEEELGKIEAWIEAGALP